MWAGWQRWGLASVLAGTCTFVIDRVRVAILSGGRGGLTWLQEWTLWSGHVLLAIAVVALGTLAWLALGIVPTRMRDRMWAQLVVPSVVVLVAVARPLHWVGAQLASGAWISEQWFAPMVALSPLALGVTAAPLVVHLAFAPVVRSRRRTGITWTLAAGVVVLALADHRVAPGIHPAFHMLVQVLATCAAVVAIGRTLAEREGWRAAKWRWPVAVAIAIAWIGSPLSWATMGAATRSALVLRSPVARDWIRHAMPERPSTLLHDVLAELDVHAGRYAGGDAPAEPTPFPGRGDYNIVLVVVDTLRADALPPARPDAGLAFAQDGDTPRIDAWLANAYRFRYAYSASTKTHRAMPAMFRSIEADDDPVTTGVPLGLRMEQLGLHPAASVNTFFIAEKFPSILALTEGFGQDIAVYEKSNAPQAVPNAVELMRSFGDERFFVWLHLYTMHDPGFSGELLKERDGSRVERYRMSLQYLDQQFGELLDALAESKLADRTIVVLTADHGEGLGDHGQMLHGPNTFEEDIGVPLAFGIPGQPGKIIEETVGTIDMAPTLVDLLGAPPFEGDRGRSLVPLFVRDESDPDRPYYFQSADDKTVGIVVGRDKLIYERGLDVAHRFDVAMDPDEQYDLFDPGGELDRSLLRTLVEYQPGIVEDELATDGVRDLLEQRLDEVDPEHPGAALPLLLRLAALAPERPVVRRAAEIFEDGDTSVKLLVARHLLARSPKTVAPKFVAWLGEIEGTPLEIEVVAALARQGQTAFSQKTIVARMGHYAKTGAPATWEPWLRLVKPWSKNAALYGPPLTTMLARAGEDATVSTALLELVLQNAGSLETKPKRKKAKTPTELTGETRTDLLAAARPLVGHADPRIRTGALRVLGQLQDDEARELARTKMLDATEDLRVRREAASTFTRLAGDDAIADLITLSETKEMTTFAVRNLVKIGTMEVVPFLRKISRTHHNNYLRREARNAADHIESKQGRKRGRP